MLAERLFTLRHAVAKRLVGLACERHQTDEEGQKGGCAKPGPRRSPQAVVVAGGIGGLLRDGNSLWRHLVGRVPESM